MISLSLTRFCCAVRFTIPFLKQLLGQPLEVSDLEAADPVLYKNKIERILQCDENELQALELTFVEEQTVFGVTKVYCDLTRCLIELRGGLQEVDLLPSGGGSEEAVNTGNRSVYLRLLCHHLMTSTIEQQTAAVERGLLSVIPEPMVMVSCVRGEAGL